MKRTLLVCALLWALALGTWCNTSALAQTPRKAAPSAAMRKPSASPTAQSVTRAAAPGTRAIVPATPRAGSAAASRVQPASANVPATTVVHEPTSIVHEHSLSPVREMAGPHAHCADPTCLSCPSVCHNPCWNWCDQWFVDGWLDQGFTGNPDSESGLVGPAGTNGPLIFNDQANEYMLNQLYLSFGRKVDRNPYQWDLGGQVDVLYGTDYFFVQSVGLETNSDGSPKWNSGNGPRDGGNAGLYGLALPQFFVEANIPWGNGLKVKAGHFYTIMGYESVRAPENFFYSHTYMMQYGEPFTHTGMMASYETSPCMTWHGGITRGWDTFEQENGQVGFLGGFSWVSPHEATRLSFSIHTGSEDPTGENNRTAFSIVFQQRINQCWTYVLHQNFGTEENARVNADGELAQAIWYGLSNYLYYTVNPCLDLGVRFEWFNDRDNARVFGLANDAVADGGSYFDLSLGANYHPTSWFILRPEVRWDWSDLEAPGIDGAYNNGTSNEQFTIGFDLITVF